MKLILGSGTPIECDSVEIDGPMVKATSSIKKDKGGTAFGVLVVAYHLREGETVRRNGDGNYEVNL